MKTLIIGLLLLSLTAFGQNEINQEWNAFVQSVDVLAYQGGQFRFRGFVKAEVSNKFSNARLWARIDKKKGIGFFDNMHQRPIVDSTWKEYEITGDIDPKALKLNVGGLYFGNGKYWFDQFYLEAKTKTGKWEELKIVNNRFEDEPFQNNWKTFYKVKGFESMLTNEGAYEGKSLQINGTSRKGDSKYLSANGITIHYKEFGKGDTVLLLHGNSESLQSFNKQIPEFAKEFYVLAMDSRGQGYSSEDGKKLSYELMAEDVVAFIDQLKIKQVNLVGWSDGGNIGLILAMRYPTRIKSLSIMGANLYNDNTSVDGKINKQLKRELDKLVKLNQAQDQWRIKLINLLLTEPKINPEQLKSINCPTLVMAGSKDVIKEEHTRLIAGKIQNAQLVIFDKGTHYEPIENPDRFNKTVLEFLRRVK